MPDHYAGPFAGYPKPFVPEWVNWSVGREENLPGSLDIEVPKTVVPKSTGEALAQSAVKLRECKNVKG